MKQAVVYAPYDLRWEEKGISNEPLKPREALVQTEYTAVSSGTEISIYCGTHKRYQAPGAYPATVGYLNVGRVEEVGPEVKRVRQGDRVYSRAGHVSEYVENEGRLVLVPDDVSSEQACFNYLATLGLHALRRGEFAVGEKVAIVGLGVIGLTAAAMAKACAAEVVGVDIVSHRLEVAQKLGLDRVLSPVNPRFSQEVKDFSSGVGVDLVIEAAGSWKAVSTALGVVRNEGRVVILARHHDVPDFNPLGEEFYRKQIKVIATSNDPWEDESSDRIRFTLGENCRYVLNLMSQGEIDLAPIITHRFSCAELQRVYDRLVSGDKEMIGILLRWC